MPSLPKKATVPFRKAPSVPNFSNATQTNNSNLILNIEVDAQQNDTRINVTIQEVDDDLSSETGTLGLASIPFQGLSSTVGSVRSAFSSVNSLSANSQTTAMPTSAVPTTFLRSSLPASSVATGTSVTLPAGTPEVTGTADGSMPLLLVIIRTLFSKG